MDPNKKINLIKREAEKFVALDKKNKESLEEIAEREEDLIQLKKDLDKQAKEQKNKDDKIKDSEEELKIREIKVEEINKQNKDILEKIEVENKVLEIQRKQIKKDLGISNKQK